MNYLWRLCLSIIITFVGCFFINITNSLALESSTITAIDWFKMGVQQIQENHYPAAIEYFNLAIETKDNYTAAYKNRCLAYLQIADYSQAIKSCNQALNLASPDSEVYLNIGLAKYRQGNYLKAIKDYNQALILKPDDFRVYYNRGLAFAAQDDLTQAIADYNQALSAIPANNINYNSSLVDIYNDKGLAYFELGNFSQAMNNFGLAISLNSDDDRAYFNRGCVCERSGDNLGARYNFSQVIQIQPGNALAYFNRGVANYHLGYYQKAISDLQQASIHFEKKGQELAYKNTLELLKVVQSTMSSVLEIV
ncbi:MAG: tetratricopeptide repeat protein [Sphaerospermopsis sp. SIO1G2]|nr:tetratricopeptide repeat protein [Sphaerospermopsis sp. SIO1G2]